MNIIEPNADGVQVIAAPHPLRVDRTEIQMRAGDTLAEMLERAQPDPVLRQHARILIGDWEVTREHWHRVRPKPGTTVTIRVVPHGGSGGKNPLRTVLQIAVIAAAAAVSAGALGPGGALLGASGIAGLGAGSVGAALAGTAIAVAGPLITDGLTQPETPA
ncbi:hypothetical protein [Ferruginivarius sediminum]|uniref:Uncharacterized protein n=1 Tax=Ferruginivarius sediminum TaxID=2661937 RepID=A0A369TEZ0_9PROT|nr:hypothetical protein [Ferruginivarius sediminum]RDD63820.1 hypothetical protein DRB17_01240 [Ferruginivarius sediminum]